MSGLKLEQLKKSFEAVEVIKGVDLEIEHGEFVVFVGPSGCGKSTLLRLIAGLEDITSGDLWIGDKLCNEVEPRDRGIAMVFQSYALYPHMTVYDNIGFGLKLAKTPKDERDAKIREAARILQMEDLLKRKPGQLSGGQRQRVAIGRAIVRQPEVFLFDEPLSNLDAALRVTMRQELSKLHQDIGATMIYVTHDQIEAMTMADKIVVLSAGAVMQVGSPMELYKRPANLFVAGFIGSPKMNFAAVTVSEVSESGFTVDSGDFGKVSFGKGYRPVQVGDKLTLGVRPHELELKENGVFSGTVDLVERLGNETVINFNTASGAEWTAVVDGDAPVDRDGAISFSADDEDLLLFDANEQNLVLPEGDA